MTTTIAVKSLDLTEGSAVDNTDTMITEPEGSVIRTVVDNNDTLGAESKTPLANRHRGAGLREKNREVPLVSDEERSTLKR